VETKGTVIPMSSEQKGQPQTHVDRELVKRKRRVIRLHIVAVDKMQNWEIK
jgi:hypothetical protein